MSKERDEAKAEYDKFSGGKDLDFPHFEHETRGESPTLQFLIVLGIIAGSLCLILLVILGFNFLFPV